MFYISYTHYHWPIDFIDVLKSFVIILRRMGPGAWQDEGPEYAHVVFNSIKDNTRFGDVLCNLPAPVPKDDWQLKWLEVYANSVGKLPVFKDILPSILQFLCEQLQHVRFKVVRPNAMIIASKVCRSSQGSKTLHRIRSLAPFRSAGAPGQGRIGQTGSCT